MHEFWSEPRFNLNTPLGQKMFSKMASTCYSWCAAKAAQTNANTKSESHALIHKQILEPCT